MAIYGYIRCSLLKKERPPEVQIPEIAKKADELGGSLRGCELIELVDVSPYSSSAIQPRNKDLRQVAWKKSIVSQALTGVFVDPGSSGKKTAIHLLPL
jgi:hypothetical protein